MRGYCLIQQGFVLFHRQTLLGDSLCARGSERDSSRQYVNNRQQICGLSVYSARGWNWLVNQSSWSLTKSYGTSRNSTSRMPILWVGSASEYWIGLGPFLDEALSIFACLLFFWPFATYERHYGDSGASSAEYNFVFFKIAFKLGLVLRKSICVVIIDSSTDIYFSPQPLQVKGWPTGRYT